MKFTYVYSLLIFLIASSCSFHFGGAISGGSNNLNNELIDVAVSQAKSTRVLGIGGLNRQALILEAKRRLYENFPLKKGQSYGNISTDINFSSYLLFDQTSITISADILQAGNSEENEFQKHFRNLKQDRDVDPNGFEPGDTLLYFKNGDVERVRLIDWNFKKDNYSVYGVDGYINIKKANGLDLFKPFDNDAELPEKPGVNVRYLINGKPLKLEAAGKNELYILELNTRNNRYSKRLLLDDI